jgi:hypothetical protein
MNERTLHIVATSLIIAGIAVGAVCWTLDGLLFWIFAGCSAALVIAGLVVASRTGRDKDGGAQGRGGPGR